MTPGIVFIKFSTTLCTVQYILYTVYSLATPDTLDSQSCTKIKNIFPILTLPTPKPVSNAFFFCKNFVFAIHSFLEQLIFQDENQCLEKLFRRGKAEFCNFFGS